LLKKATQTESKHNRLQLNKQAAYNQVYKPIQQMTVNKQ